MTYKPGDIILNKYRIESRVGQGAFAEVYRATHLDLNAARALKILSREAPGLGSTEYKDFNNRFQLEAQLGAHLDNPHIIRVYDFERDNDTLILVMEYASGGSLADRLVAARNEGQRIPVDEALQIATDVADGLVALHAQDAVHRDLKPSNILFDAQGRAKVADLGLAQIPGGPSMRSQLSQPAPHPGTPSYMSPEQVKSAAYLQPSSDVYSLGLILFEMLTGRLYKNLRPGTRVSQLQQGVPDWLDALAASMLADDPGQRPWDGAEVARLLHDKGSLTRRDTEDGLEAETRRTVSIPRWALAIAGLILVALVIIFGSILWGWFDRNDTQIEPTVSGLALFTSTQLFEAAQVPDTPSPQSQAAPSETESGLTETDVIIPSDTQIAPTSTEMPPPPTNTSAPPTDTPAPPATSVPISSAGDTMISSVDEMVLVYVPEGEFLMGSTNADPYADADEKPQKQIYLDAFWIDRTEVSNAMFAELLNLTGNRTEGGQLWLDASDPDVKITYMNNSWQPTNGYEDHPVIELTWYAARAYCQWAGRRLPTEAEWEKAARGEDGIPYPWGSDLNCSLANYGNCVGDTVAAGSNQAGTSPYGALDMFGNAWEWVADRYGSSYYQVMPATNPQGPSDGNHRVLRGAGWDTVDAKRLRLTFRYNRLPNDSSNAFGFRCAVNAER